MAGFTSEFDSNTIAGEELRDFSYYFFSLTTDINRESKKPPVPSAQPHQRDARERNNPEPTVPGVRVLFFFASGCLSIPFGLQSMATLKEGDQWQMWEFIRK